jgi:hypothetical protein
MTACPASCGPRRPRRAAPSRPRHSAARPSAQSPRTTSRPRRPLRRRCRRSTGCRRARRRTTGSRRCRPTSCSSSRSSIPHRTRARRRRWPASSRASGRRPSTQARGAATTSTGCGTGQGARAAVACEECLTAAALPCRSLTRSRGMRHRASRSRRRANAFACALHGSRHIRGSDKAPCSSARARRGAGALGGHRVHAATRRQPRHAALLQKQE